MRTQKNEQTGQVEVVFSAELLTLSENVLQNSNDKNYKVAGIKFKDKNGTIQKSTAMIYEGNYQHGLEIGKDYLATASKGDDGNVYIRLSHLEYVDNRATVDMFNFSTSEVKADTKAPVVEKKMN